VTVLTFSAQVYVGDTRKTFKLYKAGSAEKHPASDDETLKKAFIRALNLPASDHAVTDEGNNVFRVKINNGKGKLVYKLGVDGADSAAIFHYHWNYSFDLPLNAM